MTNAKTKLKSRSFIAAAARRSNLLDCLTKDRMLMKEGVAHTGVLSVYDGKWGDVAKFEWDAAAIAVAEKPEKRLVVVGEDGQYFTAVNPYAPPGRLDPKPRQIRRARTVDGFVYACGVGREVYKRLDADSWSNVSAPAKKTAVFDDIGGFSADEIYCCGWQGELWHYDGRKWCDYSGLTNVNLTSLACVSDGNVYVVGQQGVLIKGRKDSWQTVLVEDEFELDMWDVHEFGGQIYISTMTGIHRLIGQGLEEVELVDICDGTFYRLTSADGVLWSVGDSDVLSFDGTTWARYT